MADFETRTNLPVIPRSRLKDGNLPVDPGSFGSDATVPQIPKRSAPKVLCNPVESEETRELLNQLTLLFGQARDYRRPMLGRWREQYRMVRNNFWASDRPAWMPAPAIPELWPIVDALVSWEMDQQPRYTVSPQALENSPFQQFFLDLSQNLEVVLHSSYIANAEEIEIAKGNWNKYVYGTGILKTVWDMTLAGGMGDAVTRNVSPFSFYPDPDASCLEDANYFVEVKRMSAQDVDRRFPGTFKLFTGSSPDVDVEAAPTALSNNGSGGPPTSNMAAIPPVTTPRYAGPGSARIHATDIPKVTVMEFWVREHTTYTAMDPNFNEETPRVYDGWHLYVVANGHLLMDEPATNLWVSGCHPYSRLVVRDTGEFWGESLVGQLTSAQRSLNRVLASVQQNIELTGNPVFKDAGVGRTHVTNRPGQMVKATNITAAQNSQWMDPPTAHPMIAQFIQYLQARLEAISGLTAIMKGGGPGGRNSEGVIDALQEAGFVRIRSSLKFLEAALRDAGTKKADLIAENYTTPRMVSIAGQGGERTSLTLKANHFQIPSSGGSTPLRYQLLVDVGSQRHTSRQMREDRAVQLFTLGAIDRKSLLTDINYPNATAVAAAMDQHEKELAQAAADPNAGRPTGKTAARA